MTERHKPSSLARIVREIRAEFRRWPKEERERLMRELARRSYGGEPSEAPRG